MSRAEADEWAAGSAYLAPVYHATSQDAASSIRQEGFDLSRRRFGRVWGNGIYATSDPDVASIYAGLHGAGGRDALQQVLTSIPDGYARFVELTLELRRSGAGSYVRPEALTRTIVQAGYDALEIVEVGFTPAAGGTQLVVYDPRKVVVLED